MRVGVSWRSRRRYLAQTTRLGGADEKEEAPPVGGRRSAIDGEHLRAAVGTMSNRGREAATGTERMSRGSRRLP
jgi:hypothetical protein